MCQGLESKVLGLGPTTAFLNCFEYKVDSMLLQHIDSGSIRKTAPAMSAFTVKPKTKSAGTSKRVYAPLAMRPVLQAPQVVSQPQVPQYQMAPGQVQTPQQFYQQQQVQPQQQVQQQPQPQQQQDSKQWTEEQFQEARANSQDLYDAPLNATGTRRARITQFGDSVGVDIREFMVGKFGELRGQALPTHKGIRLRIDEWEQLKAVSGEIDQGLRAVKSGPAQS